MARSKAQLKLGAFFNPTGHHVASWRHPTAQADAGINFKHYVEIAQTAERAKFDMIFLADNVCVREAKMEALSRSAQYIANFEPITLISALAGVTERIGLTCTASTSYNEPFHVARKFASLDHISGGRAGWNLVTSGMAAEALNFSREAHYGHAERYERANEFAEIVTALWDSWDDDAFIRDKASGLMFEPSKMHALNHKGKHFKVRGPLNIPRSPQGHPVIVQAGTSDDGMDVAARFAEVIFSAHLTMEPCQQYFKEIKTRAHDKFGRNPDHLKVMPGLSAYVGRTAEEAEEKFAYQNSLMHEVVAREILSTVLGNVDLTPYDFDGPLPDNLPMSNASQSTFKYVTELAKKDKLSMRAIAQVVAGARAKMVVKGTPKQIADHMEQWYVEEAADGFNIMPPHLPGSLNDFAELVIPELQRRGLFRTEYTGRTLREHLGLPRPPSRYATRTDEAAE
jgi:FMN-dependent oxidoreductase (nitrilotriacetate monooxygenase family)